MGAIKNLLVRAKADFSPLKREMDKTKRDMANFKNSVSSNMSRMGGVMSASTKGMSASAGALSMALAPETLGLSLVVAGLGTVATAGVNMAMGLENATTMVNNSLGQNAREFQDWTSSVGASFGYSEKSGAEAGATFSNILSSFISDGKELTSQTEQMMKTVAVVSSYTGRTSEDVTERIRSGLLGNTEAIEDLGIFVNVAMIESTEAFKKLANGKHWDQLDFRVQQQIRLMAILEQANKQYGNTLAETTSKNMNGLKVEWDNLMTYMGEALLPLVNMLVKGLTKVVHAFGLVFKPIASFMKGLFGYKEPPIGKGIKKQTELTNDLTKATKEKTKAEKEYQQRLFGFDQINTLGALNKGISGVSTTTPTVPTTPTTSNSTTSTKQLTDMEKKSKALSDGLKKIGEGYNALIKGKFDVAVKKFSDGMGTMWGAWTTKKKGESLTKGMQGLASAVAKVFKGDFKGASKDFKKAMDDYHNAFEGTKQKDGVDSFVRFAKAMSDLASGHSLSFFKDFGKSYESMMKALNGSSMGNAMEKTYVAIGKVINKMIAKLKSLPYGLGKFFSGLQPIALYGLDGGGVQPPKDFKNKMAKGGIVTRATKAIVGEAGTEAVVPLENNTQWIDKLASKISSKIGGGGDVIVQIGGKEFGRFAINEINKVNRQAGRNLIKV